MNVLEQFIAVNKLDETVCMNRLQQAGRISDLCVGAASVAEPDCSEAVVFLRSELVMGRMK